jgi:hypothetical protein
VNSERLAKYVVGPATPEPAAVAVDEVLTEVAALLKASKRRLQATATLTNDPGLSMHADRIRVCHVLLHSCLSNPAPTVAFAVRAGTQGLVVLDLAFQAGAANDASRPNPLSAEELQTIVETAGGAVLTTSATALSLEFRRADSPPRG